jgi:hypothetical protein
MFSKQKEETESKEISVSPSHSVKVPKSVRAKRDHTSILIKDDLVDISQAGVTYRADVHYVPIDLLEKAIEEYHNAS